VRATQGVDDTKVGQVPRNLLEKSRVPSPLILQTGTVHQLARRPVRWRGASEPPDTHFHLGQVEVVFSRRVSLGEGDVVTAVGLGGRGRIRVLALRNESTDVAYPAGTGAAVALAVGILLSTALPLGWWRAAAVGLGAWMAWRAGRAHLANTILRAAPSRHREGVALTARTGAG
jgi:hypothetical protein